MLCAETARVTVTPWQKVFKLQALPLESRLESRPDNPKPCINPELK